MRFGQPHRHLRSCESTNSLARALALAGAPDGTVVTAESQSAGRGRQGRGWTTPPNGAALAYSAIMRAGGSSGRNRDPQAPSGISPLLPLAVALACCEAIEAMAPAEPMIKWPNDIWIDGKKCAGILIEARPQDGWAVIGIGLNLAVDPRDLPPEIREKSTSIGHRATAPVATNALNRALTDWVDRDRDSVTQGFALRDTLRGRRIGWADGTGTASGIDRSGNLIVIDDRGTRQALSAGEVHLSL